MPGGGAASPPGAAPPTRSEDMDVCQFSETSLNFSTPSEIDCRRITLPRQDPMSHRIIEKRRRDRMNNCLADLSRLIPPDYLKKGRGRIEKTEIIEMAIKHLKYLQERANCAEKRENCPISAEHFRLGYQECLSEVMRYLVEGHGHFPRESICVQLINHLQVHCDNIMKGDVLNKLRCNLGSNSSSSGSSSNYNIHNQSGMSNDMQRLNGKQMDINSNDRHHQHSNTYNHSEEISAISTNDMEHFRLVSERADDSSEKNINDVQDMFTDQNMPLVNNGNFSGLQLVEGNVDEGGGRTRTEFSRKTLPNVPISIENDCQSVQDLRLASQFSPKYYCHSGHCEQISRNARKGDSSQPGDSGVSSGQGDTDNIHSYKFKNTIKQRFSQSQSRDYLSSSPSEGTANTFNSNEHSFICRDQYIANGKLSHKKRKTNGDHQSRHANSYENNQYKDQTSSSETNSSENITSVSQNSNYRSKKIPEIDVANIRTSTDGDYMKLGQHIVPHIRHSKFYGHSDNIEDNFSKFPGVGVPIFALHAKGSFYVPMNVDYDCLVPFLGPYDLLDATALQPNISLHPVTISVNFQPICFSNKPMPIRTKSKRKDWQ